MKRPSCKWKGQTDADEALPEARVARLVECHKKQKAGYYHDASPQNNIIFATNNITSPALKYWQDELASKGDATKQIYLKNFVKFTDFTGKTPDELLAQRQENQTSRDPKTQRLIESQLNKFISAKRKEGLAPATLQIYFASIRSFFEIHYFPLRMRRGDYPKGESLGVKVATKEAILKALNNKHTRNKKTINAMVLFLKDSGLRVSDARLFDYGDIAEQLESGDSFIQLTRITQKQKTIAKTFIGTEAIQALKLYLESRRNGSRRIAPEELNDKSPLFRTWKSGKVKRILRHSFSSVIRSAFLRVNEPNITAHSLRKYVQTNLERGGVNVNWIDQILGHKLINSRDAYSKPTDKQLQEAYEKAYKFLRVYPDLNKLTSKSNNAQTQTETNETKEEYIVKTAQDLNEATELIENGFTYITEMSGLKLFRKRK